jgi:hypothetical protein
MFPSERLAAHIIGELIQARSCSVVLSRLKSDFPAKPDTLTKLWKQPPWAYER